MVYSKSKNKHLTKVAKYTRLAVMIWTLLIIFLGIWTAREEMQNTSELIRNEARTHFLKDLAFRSWAAKHGGVYVPPTEDTPPNPYLLHLPDRDIETLDGKKLTLMNPAYMIRELMKDYEELYGVRGHLTSLNPLNPDNVADEWERAALESFDNNQTEQFEFSDVNGETYMRLMRPLLVAESCLKCHGHQGYEVGDIRGGVSLSIAAEPWLSAARKEITSHSIWLGIIWLIGMGTFMFSNSRIRSHVEARDQAEEAVRTSEEKFRLLYDNAPLPYQSLDEDGCFNDVNPSWLTILGYERDEVIGENYADFLHPDWKHQFIENFPILKHYSKGKMETRFGEDTH